VSGTLLEQAMINSIEWIIHQHSLHAQNQVRFIMGTTENSSVIVSVLKDPLEFINWVCPSVLDPMLGRRWISIKYF
jgi:ribulose-5-phosphate 4-epimerase/fuculose-1-phosphate aldolase